MEDKIKQILHEHQFIYYNEYGGEIKAIGENRYDAIIDEIAELFTKEETNCICTVDETTGNTMVRCCNICGKPLESENWNTLKQ